MSSVRQRNLQQEKLGHGFDGLGSSLKTDRAREEVQVDTHTGNGMDGSSIVAAWRKQPLWMVLAVASGACAAFNGVFAKLTTTSLTSNLSAAIASLFHLEPTNEILDFLIRASFFGLNLLFNALMWALFTAALTRASSTTRVSIINTSVNFMITAALGWMIFGESLPGLWWVGAGMLAAGNVVIGRREEEKGKETSKDGSLEAEGLMRAEEADLVELDDALDRQGDSGGREDQRRLKTGQDVDAPI